MTRYDATPWPGRGNETARIYLPYRRRRRDLVARCARTAGGNAGDWIPRHRVREHNGTAYSGVPPRPWRYDKLPSLAADLVQRNVAVVATINTPSVLAAKGATQTIPIVFAVGVDPIKFGLVESLKRPGGNLTGLTQLNIEMEAKRVQLLHELVPSATTIGLLVNPTSPAYSEAATASAVSAARVLGIRLLILNASTPSGIDAAFVTLANERARLLLVSGDSFLVAQREQLVALAAQHAVPTLYHRREFTTIGGLMSYGPPLSEAYYHVGDYTGRILKGEKPANMPVYQSTKFDLVINLKTAKALGIKLSSTLLATADEIIE